MFPYTQYHIPEGQEKCLPEAAIFASKVKKLQFLDAQQIGFIFFSRQYVASYFETNKNKNEIEEWMNWMQYKFFCFLSLEDSIGAPERLGKLGISPPSFYGISIFHFQTCLISSEE